MPPPFGNQIPIPIAGVDTPEIREKCPREVQLAQQAKTLTTELLREAKSIELSNLRRDKYFRVLATVVADGKDVGQTLIGAGLAVPYGGGMRTARWRA